MNIKQCLLLILISILVALQFLLAFGGIYSIMSDGTPEGRAKSIRNDKLVRINSAVKNVIPILAIGGLLFYTLGNNKQRIKRNKRSFVVLWITAFSLFITLFYYYYLRDTALEAEYRSIPTLLSLEISYLRILVIGGILAYLLRNKKDSPVPK